MGVNLNRPSKKSETFVIDSGCFPDEFQDAMKKLALGNYSLKKGSLSIRVGGQMDFDYKDLNNIRYTLSLKPVEKTVMKRSDFYIQYLDKSNKKEFMQKGWESPSKELWTIGFEKEFPSRKEAVKFLNSKLQKTKLRTKKARGTGQ